MAPLVGLEPTTHGVEDRYSIQLSYKGKFGASLRTRTVSLPITSRVLYQLS